MEEELFPKPKKRNPFEEKVTPFSKFEDIETGSPQMQFIPPEFTEYNMPVPSKVAQSTAASPQPEYSYKSSVKETQLQPVQDVPSFATMPNIPTLTPPPSAAVEASKPEESKAAPSQATYQGGIEAPAAQSPTPADKAFHGDGTKAKQEKGWDDKDHALAKSVAEKHGMTDKELLGIIRHETAGTMSPAVQNSIGATGLIQFVPSTSAELLLNHKRDEAIRAANKVSDPAERKTAIAKAEKDNPVYTELNPKERNSADKWAKESVKSMTVSQQLSLVDKYLDKAMRGKKGLDNAYTAIFAGNPNQTEMKKGTQAYANNAVLDKDKDGVITRQEWTKPVLNKIEGAPKANTAAVPASKYRQISDESQQDVYKDAENIAALANPTVPRLAINTAVNSVPLSVSAPGTPEYDRLMEKDKEAAALWYPPNSSGGERIAVNPYLSRSQAVGPIAHEIGHALGQEEMTAPGTIGYKNGLQFINGGRPAAIEAAAKQGGRAMDLEQAQIENAEAFKILAPGELEEIRRNLNAPNLTPAQAAAWKTGVPQVRSSQSFDLELMKRTSGPSPLDSKTWVKK
jgi:hypothetical protein